MSKALLVIDLQKELQQIAHCQQVLTTVNQRIKDYHEHQQPVIFVQHIESPEMAQGSVGWQLMTGLDFSENDIYFNKYYPDAFYETGLEAFLRHRQIQNIEICGAQTQYCIDTTIRVGFHLGFKIKVSQTGFSTLDTDGWTADQINHYHLKLWQGRFAEIIE